MRILIATWHRAAIGGTERYLAATAPALAARGHEVAWLFELDAAGAERVDTDGEAWCGDGALAGARAWKPDVIFAHGLASPDLEGALLEVAPAVLFAHGYYGTCGSGLKRFAVPSMEPCGRRLGAACLALIYARRCGALDPVTVARDYTRQRRRHAMLGRYRAVAVASAHMRDEFLRHGVAADRVHVAPLPLTDVVAAAQAPEPRAPTHSIAFLGRLTPEKGLGHLIRAMAAARRGPLRDLRLVVVGDGPDRARAEAFARRTGLPADWRGWQSGPARFEALRDADLLGMPSVWPEPFGLAGIEAGALGVPAVGYAVGGIPDWLIGGETGELAGPVPEPRDLAAAIERALSDPGHHQALRVGAWSRARERTPARHAAALEAVLKSACR